MIVPSQIELLDTISETHILFDRERAQNNGMEQVYTRLGTALYDNGDFRLFLYM